jgi:hypothetical protein
MLSSQARLRQPNGSDAIAAQEASVAMVGLSQLPQRVGRSLTR